MSTPENVFLSALDAVEGEQDVEGNKNPFLDALDRAGPGSTSVRQEPDVGVRRALTSGIKEGFLSPLTVFGREESELTLDETSERVANTLGEFIGFGIGFIPIAKGVGITMKGIGLTARLSPEVAQFLRFSTAGTLQAAGMAEEIEDVPRQAAIGFAAGVAIDGFFLARAMRGRATAAREVDELVSDAVLAREIELQPQAQGKSPERLVDEFQGLASETKTYDEVLVDLAEAHVETVRLPDLGDPADVMRVARERLPGAQVLSRRVIGGDTPVHEVLIHNPADDAARLSDGQIRQWESTGGFEGMGVLYNGQLYTATGRSAAPGRMQIRSLDGRVTFAPLRSDITNFLTPKVLTPQGRRFGQMRNIVTSTDEVGFTVASQGPRGASAVRRGSVDTSEYQTVRSFREFVEQNREEILRIEAPSVEEAARAYALQRGIKGLREVEEGITKRVHVFDQGTIGMVREPPRVGQIVDQSVVSESGELLSFVPGWENAIIGPLRRAGYAEKEIRNMLEIYTSQEVRRLESVMSKELQAVAERSRFQFYGGCQ